MGIIEEKINGSFLFSNLFVCNNSIENNRRDLKCSQNTFYTWYNL